MKGLCGVGGDLFGDVWDDIEREQRGDMCVHTCPHEIQNYLWEVSGRPKMRVGPPDLGKLTRNRGPRSVSDAPWEIQNDLREVPRRSKITSRGHSGGPKCVSGPPIW